MFPRIGERFNDGDDDNDIGETATKAFVANEEAMTTQYKVDKKRVRPDMMIGLVFIDSCG